MCLGDRRAAVRRNTAGPWHGGMLGRCSRHVTSRLRCRGPGRASLCGWAGSQRWRLRAAVFVLGLVAGQMARHFGSKNLVIVGSVIGAVGYFLVAVAHDFEWGIYLITLVVGVGFGMAFAAMSNLIVATVPARQTGVASGMNANIRTIGGALGGAVMAGIVTAGAAPSGSPKESGCTNGFLMPGRGPAAERRGRTVHPERAARSAHPRRARGRVAARRVRSGPRRHLGERRIRVTTQPGGASRFQPSTENKQMRKEFVKAGRGEDASAALSKAGTSAQTERRAEYVTSSPPGPAGGPGSPRGQER